MKIINVRSPVSVLLHSIFRLGQVGLFLGQALAFRQLARARIVRCAALDLRSFDGAHLAQQAAVLVCPVDRFLLLLGAVVGWLLQCPLQWRSLSRIRHSVVHENVSEYDLIGF